MGHAVPVGMSQNIIWNAINNIHNERPENWPLQGIGEASYCVRRWLATTKV
jgi:hypothetical protein